MPQSLAKLHIHLVYSTKNRAPTITAAVRNDLYRYTATVVKNCGCHPVLLNAVEDHIHLLFDLARTVAVSKVVEEVKSASSKWIKTQGPEFGLFAWQAGYGAFAVGAGDVESVCKYISDQQEHHHTESFQEEYRRFLTANGIECDERYMWD
jgi:REP element-mobilizing transposase RayT